MSNRSVIVLYAPCIENPFISYLGPKPDFVEKIRHAARKFSQLKLSYSEHAIFVPYPCPEFLLMKRAPRVPCSKEMYEILGIKRVALFIADWIKEILEEIRPKTMVIVGIAYSPSCGISRTYKLLDASKALELSSYAKDGKIEKSKEIKQLMKRVEGEPGAFMEVLKAELKNYNVEFVEFQLKTIEDIDKSFQKLEDVLKKLIF